MKSFKFIYIPLLIASLQISCKKFLDVGVPKNSLSKETVFANNDQATSAMLGAYSVLFTSNGFASGDQTSISSLAGLSADEFIGYNTFLPAYENQLTPDLNYISLLYSSLYVAVYRSNAILEGLETSSGITPFVKSSLQGEALFLRAFTYFYLVNLFGKVPLQLNTDYTLTQSTPQASIEMVYNQILTDLKSAESLLTEDYPTVGRVRPNKSAVQALLARVYLFKKDWRNAEKYASLVIGKTGTYSLAPVDGVFLSTSKEAIWQLMPWANNNTREAQLFILKAAPLYVSLRNDFATTAFEANDKRKTSWVRSFLFPATNTLYYHPYKYKQESATAGTEYSMILRLAEQYLIRAEANINLEKVDLGINDLNIVRQRPIGGFNNNPISALPTNLDKAQALLKVEQERKVELFSEWGHRWLDLKRTERADVVLGPIKLSWQTKDVLYPFPLNEVNRNTNIEQNDY